MGGLRRVTPWLVQLAFGFAMYVLYVGKLDKHELITGAVCALLTAFAGQIVFERHLAPFRAEWRSVAQVWRMPKYVVAGSWEVLAVLFRQLFAREPAESLFLSVPFDTGGDDDESALRRALAIGYTSATPNFVVVGIDRARGLLLYHQVKKSEVPEMTRRLGARG